MSDEWRKQQKEQGNVTMTRMNSKTKGFLVSWTVEKTRIFSR